VRKVRLNASMTQNVVTYTVEVSTDNADGALIPYLTANAQFETRRRENVLMVPNSALRWTPEEEQVAPDVRKATASANDSEAGDGPSRDGRGDNGGGGREGRRGGEPGGAKADAGKRDGAGRRDTMAAVSGAADKDPWREGVLWVRDGEYLRPIQVRAGTSDGANTEIAGDDLSEGMEVIAGTYQTARGGGAAQPTNPFTPRFGGGGGRGRGPRL
jgi:HlyD family secretion protein